MAPKASGRPSARTAPSSAATPTSGTRWAGSGSPAALVLRSKAVRSKALRSTALRSKALRRAHDYTANGKVPQGIVEVAFAFSKARRGLVFSRFLQHILSTKKEHTKVAQAANFGGAKHRVHQRFCDFLDKKRTSKTVLAPVS